MSSTDWRLKYYICQTSFFVCIIGEIFSPCIAALPLFWQWHFTCPLGHEPCFYLPFIWLADRQCSFQVSLDSGLICSCKTSGVTLQMSSFLLQSCPEFVSTSYIIPSASWKSASATPLSASLRDAARVSCQLIAVTGPSLWANRLCCFLLETRHLNFLQITASVMLVTVPFTGGNN